MKFTRASAVVRKLIWRLGRKMCTYARGDGKNDLRTKHPDGAWQRRGLPPT